MEDLTAPDTAGLMPGQCRRKTLGADRAAAAQLLGLLQFGRRLGKPQIWIVGTTRLLEPVVLRGVKHDGDVDRTRCEMWSVSACPDVGRERYCGHAIHPPVMLIVTWLEHRSCVEGEPFTAWFAVAFLRM